MALTKIVNELKSLEKISAELISAQTINEILNHILDKGSITYEKFRSYINLHESINFKSLNYDKDNEENAKLVDFKKALGEHSFNRQELDQISTYITLIKDNVKLKTALEKYNLSNEQINNLLEIEFNDHINLSF